jgi:hypothetical protein
MLVTWGAAHGQLLKNFTWQKLMLVTWGAAHGQ